MPRRVVCDHGVTVEAFDDAARRSARSSEISVIHTVRHTVRVGSDRVSGRSQGDPDHDCESYECARHPRGARAGPAGHGRGSCRRERRGPRRATVTFDALNRMVNRLANGLYEGGRAPATGWCGADRTRSRCSRRSTRPARPGSSRCRCRTASTPRRCSTSSTTPTRRSSSSTPSRRRSSPTVRDQLPKVRDGASCYRRRRSPDGLRRWDDVLAGAARHRSRRRPGRLGGRRRDALHVGHHRASRRARCAPTTDRDARVRAARRA